MQNQSVGQKLRDLIDGPNILVLPGVFNGYSARLVEQFGFKAAGITGAGLSEDLLGCADVGLMGLEENLSACRRLVACGGTLLLMADGDTGYGGPLNVYHSVRGFEQTGVAGVMIEDQSWPKRCGMLEGVEVIPVEEMVQKITAAVEARRDPAFVLRARTDAYRQHGLKEAIRRLNVYAEAGADVLYAAGLYAEDDIEIVLRNVSKPLVVGMGLGLRRTGDTPVIPARRLQEMGIAMVAYPRLLTACAIQGMKRGLVAFQSSLTSSGEVKDEIALQVSFEEINDLMGLNVIEQMEKRFAGEGRAGDHLSEKHQGT